MDDGGQRLLDVIEDPHALDIFLRENLSNSALEENSRYDTSNNEGGLVNNGGLDNFVFDGHGQLVDPLRGGQAHTSHHSHQVNSHVLQQVLHPTSLSAASTLPGSSHQLHHQIHHHHQTHHLQQSNLLQQHHAQQQHLQHAQQHHQANHPPLPSPIGGSALDVDCIGRNRDSSCSGNRNESDHTLQQLLASASPIGSSQQILQLHHQAHHHSLHQSHSTQLQHLNTQSHQHLQQQQQSQQQHQQSHHNQSLLPSPIPPPVPSSNSLLQHHVDQSSHRQQTQRQQHQQQQQQQQQHQQRHHASQSHKSLSHQNASTHESQTQLVSDLSNSILPIGLQSVTTSSSSCNGNISTQPSSSNSVSASQQDVSRLTSKTLQGNSSVNNSTSKIVSSISSQNIVHSGSHGITTSRVQVMGGHNQVLSSATQQLLAPSTSQLFSGTQIVQPSIPTQVISGGSILAGGQVLSAPNVLPGGQVLSSVPSGQVFQGSQLLSNAQVLTNHLLNTSHVITTVAGIPAPTAPLYVTPSAVASQIHQPPPPPPPVIQNAIGSVHQNVITSSLTPLSSPSTASSTFTVPSKSPASSLPRTSPGPSYPATPSPHHTTPSPASYPNKSPAPSPHSNASTLKSPVPTSSPAVSATSQSVQAVGNVSSSSHNSAALVSGVVGNVSMVQGLVPHLPITKVGGSNGVVLAPGGNSMQVTTGIKQVVQGGQLIQIVSSPNNPTRQTVTLPHPKPIQPKQPQLLPKPSPQGGVRQPTPPPSGKTLIGTRPTPPNSQQPIVLGTSNQQPTVITGQQNLGSIVLNSSLLQPGLQQPILIPQPNGVQLLVRPAGHPAGAAGQTLLVPMPSQSHVVTSMGKVPQPQTLVIPGSGQTPALVIPQGLTPALGGAGMLNAQNARAPQPIIRLVAPHAPLQLQQINTASGPMLVAVPVNQTALNLPGVFATASSSMRTLSPQVTPGTLQIGSSLGPVSLNPLQMAPGSLQVNNTSQPLSLSASLPTPLSSVITTTTTTTMATRSSEDSLALSTSPIQSNIQLSAQPPSVDTSNKNNSKKKSKKKKKEKDSKEDKGKGKGVSINLNELLKETGIFDENEFGGLGVEDTDANLGASHGLVLPPPQQTSLPPSTSVIGTSINCKISTSPGQLIFSTPVSQPISSVSLSHNITPSIITSSSVSTFGQNTLPVTSVPTSMCFTFDVHGKLVLGPSDSGKPHITAIAGSVPTQLMSPSGVGLNLNSGGTFVIGNNEPASIPVSKSPVTGGPTVGHIVALHPPTVSQLGDISQSSTLMKIDNTHQLLASSKAITSSPQNHMEIIKTVQNNNMVQSQPDKSVNNSHSILTSILSNSVSPIIGVNTGNPETNISVSLTGTDKVNYINTDGKQLTDYSSNGIITSHPSQLPINPAVIVSSYANTFLPGAIISSKTPTSSFNILTSSNSVSNPKTSLVNTLSASVQSSEKNILYSPYTSNLNSSSVVESKIKKSSKKKKKDKESAASQTTTIYSANQIHQDKSKSNSLSAYVGSSSSPILIQNGSISPSSLAGINKLENSKIDHGPLLTNGQTIPQATPVYSSSTLNYLTSVSNTTVTSNSIVSTMSNSKPSTHVSLSTNLTNSVTEGAKLSFPIISTHSSLSGPTSSFIVQPGQQVKQLLLSPQNQEALKRVHSQIQDIQNKKGSLSEQDKALQQKLISEYKKIMATGTPVPMSQSSLSQLSHNINTSQHNPIKYSHSVGHKKIYLTPNQKKGYPQTNHQSSKKHNPEPNKVSDSKLKENNDPVTGSCVSSSNTFSSHSATTTSGFHVSVAVSTAVNNSCVSSVSNSTTPVHQLVSPVVQESECVKSLLENESVRHVNVGTEPVTCRNHSPSRASMPLIIANTKTSPTLPGIITTSSIPLTTTTTTYQPVIDMQSVPVSPHINISSNVGPVSCAAPSPVLTPQLSSTSQVIHPPLSSPTCTTSSTSALTSTQTLPIGAAGISLAPQHQQSQSQSSAVSTNNPIRTIASLPRTREELFEIHLKTDHNGVLNPDYRTPFKSKTDVCKRLIRYHVYNDFSPSQQELLNSEYQFELHGEALIKKFNAMKYKYKSLLLKDSMRRHPSAETAMLYRYFVTDERATLEREKLEVANGKELDLPPPPPHWVGGDIPPAGPPFPWEEEWHNDKAYVVSYDQVKEEEEEEGEENEEEKVEGFSSLNAHAKEGEKYFVSSPLGDDGRTSRSNSQWEDDLEEECQDEGRLQILMEDETDESKSQDADLVEEEEEGPGSLLSDNGGYFSRSPVNYDDSDKETVVQDGRTSSSGGGGSNIDCNRQRSYSSEKDNSKCIYNNKYNIKESWSSNDNCYTPYSKFPVRSVYENEINSSETVPGTKENGIEEHVDSSIGSRNNCVPQSHAIGAFDSAVSSYHSKIKEFCDGKISCNSDIYYNSSNQMELSKLGKYNKHDRKPKSERDKRKRERSREKSSRYSEKEEKARSSKKLKIKLKHEEKAVVRPLRIKSDERTSGGLKLTLKKQEGSSGYYRVGDERGREYRVEPSKEEEVESTLLPVLENQSNGKGDSSSGEQQQQQHLRGVSVVLEDCLQVEPKNKKELDSPMRGYNKRSKRLKSSHHHHQNSINDEYNSDRYHERENNVSWSSRFVDTVSTGVDKFIDSSSNLAAPSSRSNNHNANYYYQSSHSRQYSLEPSSLSHFRKQPLCVPSSGQQKVIHQQQTPRNSQRLS